MVRATICCPPSTDPHPLSTLLTQWHPSLLGGGD